MKDWNYEPIVIPFLAYISRKDLYKFAGLMPLLMPVLTRVD